MYFLLCRINWILALIVFGILLHFPLVPYINSLKYLIIRTDIALSFSFVELECFCH